MIEPNVIFESSFPTTFCKITWAVNSGLELRFVLDLISSSKKFCVDKGHVLTLKSVHLLSALISMRIDTLLKSGPISPYYIKLKPR